MVCSDFDHDSNLGGCMCLVIYPFLLDCLICWYIVSYIVSHDLLYFCGINFSVSLLIYKTESSFLMSLAKSLFSKSLIFIDFFFYFSIYFINFCSDLCYFLPSFILSGLCSFSSSLRYKVGWLILDLVNRAFINFLLGTAFPTSHRFWCIVFPFSF